VRHLIRWFSGSVSPIEGLSMPGIEFNLVTKATKRKIPILVPVRGQISLKKIATGFRNALRRQSSPTGSPPLIKLPGRPQGV
jgi:hypothetical protein